MHEMGWTLNDWACFYLEATKWCFERARAAGAPAVIYSTDQKHAGRWVSSFALMMRAAERANVELVWHKIVLRRDPGKVDIHRPGFTHMAAFGGESIKPGKATPDLIRRGASPYPNGTGLIPARMACEFAGRAGRVIADPFCGRGTIPAVAEALGFDSIGIDIDPAQAEAARKLTLRKATP